MKKFTAAIAFVPILCAFFSLNNVLAAELPVLSQKEVADLAEPSVVRIIQKVKGEAKVTPIKLDLLNMNVKSKEGTEPVTVQIDDYLYGTGTIVHPDGYILTNSHVISIQSIKNLVAADFVNAAFDEAFSSLQEEDFKKLNSEKKSDEELNVFSKKISDFILSNSEFNIEKALVVLNPLSQNESLPELFQEGFPVTVVSVNDNFYKDDRDAGLIKIDQKNLPALSSGSASGVSTGKKVYLFGYPFTAQIGVKEELKPTFTQGTIGSLKDSVNKDFKILQTDAKVSSGSSGGPLLDENGKMIGLVTFMTSEQSRQEAGGGDTFAFAVPIDEALEIVKDNRVSPNSEIPPYQPGSYESHFLGGLGLFQKNQCRKALEEFQLAKSLNENFKVGSYLGLYEKQCQEKISAGQSLDTYWQILQDRYWHSGYIALFLAVGGILLIVVLALTFGWLYRRMRKDETELDNVEEYLNLSLEDGKPLDEEEPEINSSEFDNEISTHKEPIREEPVHEESTVDDGLPDHLKPR